FVSSSDTAPTEIYTLSLHDALPIFGGTLEGKSDISIYASVLPAGAEQWGGPQRLSFDPDHSEQNPVLFNDPTGRLWLFHTSQPSDRKSTRLNSSHVKISYAVFCLKK